MYYVLCIKTHDKQTYYNASYLWLQLIVKKCNALQPRDKQFIMHKGFKKRVTNVFINKFNKLKQQF